MTSTAREAQPDLRGGRQASRRPYEGLLEALAEARADVRQYEVVCLQLGMDPKQIAVAEASPAAELGAKGRANAFFSREISFILRDFAARAGLNPQSRRVRVAMRTALEAHIPAPNPRPIIPPALTQAMRAVQDWCRARAA